MATNGCAPPPEGPLRPLLKMHDVCRILGLSRASVNRLERSGALTPIRVTKNSVRWRERDVEAYLDSLSREPRA